MTRAYYTQVTPFWCYRRRSAAVTILATAGTARRRALCAAGRGTKMANLHRSVMDETTPYRIWVQGRVSERWIIRHWDLNTIEVKPWSESPGTQMVGEIIDQAALIGLINMLYDMGHAIIAVERLPADPVADNTDE